MNLDRRMGKILVKVGKNFMGVSDDPKLFDVVDEGLLIKLGDFFRYSSPCEVVEKDGVFFDAVNGVTFRDVGGAVLVDVIYSSNRFVVLPGGGALACGKNFRVRDCEERADVLRMVDEFIREEGLEVRPVRAGDDGDCFLCGRSGDRYVRVVDGEVVVGGEVPVEGDVVPAVEGLPVSYRGTCDGDVDLAGAMALVRKGRSVTVGQFLLMGVKNGVEVYANGGNVRIAGTSTDWGAVRLFERMVRVHSARVFGEIGGYVGTRIYSSERVDVVCTELFGRCFARGPGDWFYYNDLILGVDGLRVGVDGVYYGVGSDVSVVSRVLDVYDSGGLEALFRGLDPDMIEYKRYRTENKVFTVNAEFTADGVWYRNVPFEEGLFDVFVPYGGGPCDVGAMSVGGLCGDAVVVQKVELPFLGRVERVVAGPFDDRIGVVTDWGVVIVTGKGVIVGRRGEWMESLMERVMEGLEKVFDWGTADTDYFTARDPVVLYLVSDLVKRGVDVFDYMGVMG